MSNDIFPGVRLDHDVETAQTEDGVVIHGVHPDDLFLAVRSLKDQGFTLLSCLSAYDTGSAFGVFYAFIRPANTPQEFAEVRLRCEVAKPEDKGEAKTFTPRIPSIVDVYKAADWQEREMYDMYGIDFTGHPDLRRILLPEPWHGFPMRKDYSEPEQYVGMCEGEDIVTYENEEGTW